MLDRKVTRQGRLRKLTGRAGRSSVVQCGQAEEEGTCSVRSSGEAGAEAGKSAVASNRRGWF
ncbi:uncharacterized protein H6S33_008668 [Morchella sextelata]|uniref:uncharacterized protein n=1 Tax=Morchella sextelata TaxID=1174677 RepID=UPI001D04639A|nr:uncharacterized protein H6S33_008668 [Morchella sextelata]KAH0602587.1 hypothetical protein H6S33_008668 [Morchella sextelata]